MPLPRNIEERSPPKPNLLVEGGVVEESLSVVYGMNIRGCDIQPTPRTHNGQFNESRLSDITWPDPLNLHT
jgi:hypothetical protein